MQKTISEQIKEHIKKSGISLYRLSIDSGVGLRVLTRFVNEGSDMKASNLDKLCDTLGLTISKVNSKTR